jgi:hypothetical protein
VRELATGENAIHRVAGDLERRHHVPDGEVIGVRMFGCSGILGSEGHGHKRPSFLYVCAVSGRIAKSSPVPRCFFAGTSVNPHYCAVNGPPSTLGLVLKMVGHLGTFRDATLHANGPKITTVFFRIASLVGAARSCSG